MGLICLVVGVGLIFFADSIIPCECHAFKLKPLLLPILRKMSSKRQMDHLEKTAKDFRQNVSCFLFLCFVMPLMLDRSGQKMNSIRLVCCLLSDCLSGSSMWHHPGVGHSEAAENLRPSGLHLQGRAVVRTLITSCERTT